MKRKRKKKLFSSPKDMVCRFKVLPIPGWSLLGLFPVDETSLENLFVERRLSSDPLWPVIRVQPTLNMISYFWHIKAVLRNLQAFYYEFSLLNYGLQTKSFETLVI